MSTRSTGALIADLRVWIEDDEDDPNVAGDVALLREVADRLSTFQIGATTVLELAAVVEVGAWRDVIDGLQGLVE